MVREQLVDLVIVNVYVPYTAPEQRLALQQRFLQFLGKRCEQWFQRENHKVIVLGELNIAYRHIDHDDLQGTRRDYPKCSPNWNHYCAESSVETKEERRNGTLVPFGRNRLDNGWTDGYRLVGSMMHFERNGLEAKKVFT